MSFLNENENELVMEPMISSLEEPKEKKVSKTLTMNEKRVMYGILSFLVIANRDGILDDTKTQELMEHLPIFGTISEKKAFLSQEMFDMKMIEKDILKPMILEHNNKKKNEKKEEKKKGKLDAKVPKEKVSKEKVSKEKVPKEKVSKEKVSKEKVPKEKVSKEKVEDKVDVNVLPEEEVPREKEKVSKKRVSKKKEDHKVSEVKEDHEVPVSPVKEKKRGRKAKQQIVECNTEVNLNAGNSQEDQLADLVNQLTNTKPSILELQNPNDIDLEDLDEVLSNLDEEKEKEKPDRVMTPRLPEVEVEENKENKTKKKVPKTSSKK
jgi:hypothetical protein